MSSRIVLKRSSVAGKVPQTTDLQLGEIAINTTDGKLYIKKSVDGVESVVSPTGCASSGISLQGSLSLYVNQSTTLTITNYDSATSYSVSATGGTATISGDTITYTADSTAGSFALSVTASNTDGTNMRSVAVTVNAVGILQPTNASPSNAATNQDGPSLTLSASAFQTVGMTDTHASSDWQVATDSAFTNIISSVSDSTTSKTSWQASNLAVNTTYYWRVRYRGATGAVSAWSTATTFSTKAQFGGLIGTQGGQGFGVGVYSGTLPSGFTAMTGATDPANANYGNYQYSDGSVMVFVPKFYYRIGNAASPRYASYGANAIDVVGSETFASEAAANAAGYALHRAFVDGGSEKQGFFIDKYLASKNGTTTCKSIQNGVPISLTTSPSFTNSNGMTGCTGIHADAVVLSRARGAGVFNVASVFMYSALALLSLAHGQAATSATYCAWYDSSKTTNFPKGCNNGALADTNDATVTFTSAGDAEVTAKPKTGSASNLAKTTHNGQASGVTDINGAMWQVMLGVTSPGNSATDSAVIANGGAYVLKRSIALASLTGNFGGANDAWGTASNLAANYDYVSDLFPWESGTGWVYFGNGSNNVFSGATSGSSYLRTACGVQDTVNGASASGTNQFGNDGCLKYNRANQFPAGSASWVGGSDAGVFCRGWYYVRSGDSGGYVGFRAAAYGS